MPITKHSYIVKRCKGHLPETLRNAFRIATGRKTGSGT